MAEAPRALQGPLSVAVKTGRAWRIVTDDLTGLRIRNTAPGGYASIQMKLANGARLPLSRDPDELDYYGRVYVFDTRTGEVVCEGRIEDLGRTAGDGGQEWDIVAVGPSAHAEDVTKPYVCIDRMNTAWKPSSINLQFAQWQQTNDESDPGQGMRCYIPEGTDVPANTKVGDVIYQMIGAAGQQIARLVVDVTIGFNDAGWASQVITKSSVTGTPHTAGQFVGPGSGTPPHSTTLVCALDTDGGGSIVTGDKYVTFRATHISGAGILIPDTLCWFQFDNWYVKAVRQFKDGTTKTSGYSGETLTSNKIVEDILPKFLPMYDGTNASITTGGYDINQFAYYDGVTASKMFDDLMLHEPALVWQAWESNTAGLYRFEWKPWDTLVSYEGDILFDQFDAPSTAVDLYDAVTVRYAATSGTIKNVQRTQTVSQLTAAGFSRQGWIDLGDEIGSTENATQAGDEFLAERQFPANAGTVTIGRPLVNLQTGLLEYPWQFKSGRLIRMRGVDPNPDSLNPAGTARDGVTVFKIKSAEYDAEQGTVSLELDTYSRTTARALADFVKQPRVRRR